MVKNNNDKWGALSMAERASLINIYTQGGVLDLKKMKEHYNSFGNGGRILDGESEEKQTLSGEVPIFQEKNTVLNVSPINFLPQNTIREAYNNKDAVHTIGNWLNNRREQLYNNMQQMYAAGKVPEPFFGLPFFKTPFYLENDKNKEVNQEINRQLNKVEQADYEEKLLPLFTNGLYDTKNNKVLLSTTLDEGSYGKDVIKLHEFLHASGYNSPQEYVIAQYFKGRQGDKYILDPSEIYARLGTFRKMFNIDPNHKYTLEEVKSLRSQLKEDYGDSYFLRLSKPFNDKIHKLKAEYVSRNIPKELKTMWWWKGDEDFKKTIYSDSYYLNQIIEDFNIELPQEIELIEKEKEKAIEKYKKGKSTSEIRTKDFDGVMWMDNFSDEDMVFLLNEVAQNTTDDNKLDYVNPDNIAALGGPLYNKHNPIESFSGSSKIPVVRKGAKVFDEGGSIEEDSRSITPEERVEYTMRKSKGVTGKRSEILSYPTLISMYNAFSTEEVPSGWSVSDAVSQEDSYTGTLMLGAKNKTDNGLGFSTTKELIDELGYTPVDFVESYVTGKTPFKELGVIEKDDQGEIRLLRKSIQGRDVPIYQTHKDTLSAKDLDYLYKELEKGFPKKGDNTYTTNSTYKNSPYRIGDSNIYYDGNNHQVVHIKLPDGKTAFKAVDYYDFNPDNWNYKVLPGTKKFLSYLDEHGNPFVVTSPWYLKEDTRSLNDRLLDYGIMIDASGHVHQLETTDGKVWTLEDALKDIESKKYF